MARKEEYQKAAYEYINSDAVRPENMQMAYGDFINGAKWADAHTNLESISHSLYETPNPRFHWIAIFYPYEDKSMPSIAISTLTDFEAIKAITPYGKWFYAKDLFPFINPTEETLNKTF